MAPMISTWSCQGDGRGSRCSAAGRCDSSSCAKAGLRIRTADSSCRATDSKFGSWLVSPLPVVILLLHNVPMASFWHLHLAEWRLTPFSFFPLIFLIFFGLGCRCRDF